ncbi:hypothetical protein MNEG_8149 [Monoraphidium neglectum]|uniref:General transcription and DNA repair factor IIH subunit TFB5 n=1 Tax=Monoraphidium neglectum TaxID=145388 RepID=A0A0D2M956_9CHLO|nr:hypothetical protein MNEG_8149 [Monoraphidium neglectum]KIY99814.1 hypothetical protein MNEG_8149 [Monoraphidium neglectum]|eukprot:XP_013898834.1 hypothetical protein MNEG_8149 [Monoraphidium neglectum]
MVYASNGVLIATGKFIIAVLDDTHLFVKADKVDFVREKVQEFNDKNVYQPPADKGEEGGGRGRAGK